MVGENHERLGVDVADGDQMILGQDEPDRVAARLAAGDAVEHRHGHERRAVFLIEPARRLDFGQFLAGRDVGSNELFGKRFLGLGRFEEIDPDRAFGNRAELVRVHGRCITFGTEQTQHGTGGAQNRSAWQAWAPIGRASVAEIGRSSPSRSRANHGPAIDREGPVNGPRQLSSYIGNQYSC